jgi:hypothetical protein
MNKFYNSPKSSRDYTRLFPKVTIYREMDPKYIPVLSSNPLGYGEAMQEPINKFLQELVQENGGLLPRIKDIGSYSATTGRCLVSFKNEGPYSPEWFAKKAEAQNTDPFYKSDSYLD